MVAEVSFGGERGNIGVQVRRYATYFRTRGNTPWLVMIIWKAAD
jgi:hypothetical protein